MSYPVQPPPVAAPSPPAPPGRPAVVTAAAALLWVMATVGLIYAISTLVIVPGTVGRFRDTATGDDPELYVGVVWLGAAVALALAVIIFALYIVLGIALRRGSNAARITTLVVSGLGVLTGAGAALIVAAERRGDSVPGTTGAQLSDAYPGGWISTNIGLAVAQLIAYAVVAALVLAAPKTFFGGAKGSATGAQPTPVGFPYPALGEVSYAAPPPGVGNPTPAPLSGVPYSGPSYGAQGPGAPYDAQHPGAAYGAQHPGAAYGAQHPRVAEGAQHPGGAYGAQHPDVAYGAQHPGPAYGAPYGTPAYGPPPGQGYPGQPGAGYAPPPGAPQGFAAPPGQAFTQVPGAAYPGPGHMPPGTPAYAGQGSHGDVSPYARPPGQPADAAFAPPAGESPDSGGQPLASEPSSDPSPRSPSAVAMPATSGTIDANQLSSPASRPATVDPAPADGSEPSGRRSDGPDDEMWSRPSE